MNTAEHRFVGALLHDRISARWSSVSPGEMLLIQNKRVNWDTARSGSRGRPPRTTRTVDPFDPKDGWRRFSNVATRSDGTRTRRHCKGFDGLSALVVHRLQCDPLSGDVYWFLTSSWIASHP